MNAGASTSAPVKHAAFPEWLTRKDDNPGAWTVHEGTATRGDAWTNNVKCEMRVPFGDDEISRAVRAHEMVHAKVSPKIGISPAYAASIMVSTQSLTVAEEFRVNMLASAAGFDMDNLRDGSETLSGEIAARNKDWNGAVNMLAAVAGTKGANDFLRGVKKHDPEMERLLRKVQNELKKMWRNDLKRYGTKRIGSTEIKVDNENAMPDGFHRFTAKYAKYIQSLQQSEEEDGDGEGLMPNESEIKAGGKNGEFAKLVELKIPKPVKVDGRIGRKRVPSEIGRNPRRINRLLTDPEKRVFDKRTRGKGGVVLIDQSGSMSLDDKDIWNIIKHAPGCVIIGYSHRPGSTGVPNVWVIAERGKVAEDVPHGNGGNGVDGPAVRFAAKFLRTGEPFIWVCDGIVTDANDNHVSNLDVECANLVKKHRIHMVDEVGEAVEALKKVARGQRLPRRMLGYLKYHDTPDEG